mmetsp:Transcript_3312/g.6910  ORF Transcript_3312/g.6910 Transcript_3312/m.6910 type:complete len:264 (+) Transcript_3312:1084-1875(+)
MDALRDLPLDTTFFGVEIWGLTVFPLRIDLLAFVEGEAPASVTDPDVVPGPPGLCGGVIGSATIFFFLADSGCCCCGALAGEALGFLLGVAAAGGESDNEAEDEEEDELDDDDDEDEESDDFAEDSGVLSFFLPACLAASLSSFNCALRSKSCFVDCGISNLGPPPASSSSSNSSAKSFPPSPAAPPGKSSSMGLLTSDSEPKSPPSRSGAFRSSRSSGSRLNPRSEVPLCIDDSKLLACEASSLSKSSSMLSSLMSSSVSNT